jgi:hypothetical protein
MHEDAEPFHLRLGSGAGSGGLKNNQTFAAFAGSSLAMKSSQKHDDASAEWLDSVEVRLIQEHERERFDRLIEEEHYLQSARFGGRHLRYAATVHGRWVALLAFSGAATHLKAREQWIGCKRS